MSDKFNSSDVKQNIGSDITTSDDVDSGATNSLGFNDITVQKNSCVFTNMSQSSFFSKLRYHPMSSNDLVYLCQMYGLQFFLKSDKIRALSNFNTMTAPQLDLLFVFIVVMKYQRDSLQKILVDHIFSELAKNADYENIFFDEVVELFVMDLLCEYNGNICDHAYIYNFFKECVAHAEGRMDSMDYDNLIIFLELHDKNISMICSDVHTHVFDKIKKINSTVDAIYGYIVKPVTNSDDNMSINKIISGFEQYAIDEIINQSACMEKFNEHMMASPSLNMRNGINSHEIVNDRTDIVYPSIYNSCTQDPGAIVKSINVKFENIGLKVMSGDHTSKLCHGIIHCFIEYGLVSDHEEAAVWLGGIMSEYKYSVGLINKYDQCTLFDSFVINSVGNDISISFDDFVAYLKNKKTLPWDYPIEVILRIIGRICNVVIVLYSYIGDTIIIDNSANDTPQSIIIYKYDADRYYNLVQIDSSDTICLTEEPNWRDNIIPTDGANFKMNNDNKDVTRIKEEIEV